MSSDEDSCSRRREKFRSEKPVKEEIPNKDVDDCDSYGPALPPHLMQTNKQTSDAVSFGPQLPDNYGESKKNEQKEVYGPQMPNKVIGPEIPEHLLPQTNCDEDEEEEVTNEDNTDYGPSLSLMSDGTSDNIPASLHRSRRTGSPESIAKRESWMIELPPERAKAFGLGPRQFRTRLPNEKDSDRSGWTETPMDKGKGLSEAERVNKNDAKVINKKQIEERNKEMERLIRKIEKKKKRNESLLEIHQKKMRKKEKKEAKRREKEGTTTERRPFDRNVDLQVQRFDLAQKNAVLKKAALLNDRFAQGESKFL